MHRSGAVNIAVKLKNMEIKPDIKSKIRKLSIQTKIIIAMGLVILVFIGYSGFNFYKKFQIESQQKYFNAGGQFIIKDLIGKSENCQKVKVSTGEEFVRVSCLKQVESAPFESPITPTEPIQ